MPSQDSLKVNAIAGRTDSTGSAVADQDQEETRLVQTALLGPGILPNMLTQAANPAAFNVRQDTGSNLQLKIGSGTTKIDGLVLRGTTAGQGAYIMRLDAATKTVTVPAADATNPSRYGVYAFVNDTSYGGTAGRAFDDVTCIRGTPAGSPVTPGPLAAWSAYYLLWEFQLPANSTAITNTILDAGTDQRVPAASPVSPIVSPRTFTTAAQRDARILTPVEGQLASVTGEDRVYAYDGAAWQRVGWYSFLGRTGCILRRAASQVIPTATPQAISWDTEDLDTDGFITVPSTTVTIPAGLGGIYAITAFAIGTASWYGSAGARLVLSINSINYNLLSGNIGTSADNVVGGTMVISLAAATPFTLTVQQASGSNMNMTAQLACHRIGL